jgi:predicted phosphodiesterase
LSSNNILWLSDIHIPNQDNEALKLAIDYGVKNKINCIVLGGDILDNTPFTNHDAPPPSADDVVEWFEYCEIFLSHLRTKFPKAHIVWLEGNHDNWFVRYLMKKAPMLFNDPYFRLPQRLNLKKYNVDFYEQNIVVRAGKLHMLHGHTIVRGFMAPVNAARGVFMRAKSSMIIGHVHSTSNHSETNIKEEPISCWSVGCLCTLAPDYDPHNTKHNVGFAHILVEKNGDFEVLNKRIINNKIH